MYFQLVDDQVLSTQGQPDVFNLHRLTSVLGWLLLAASLGEAASRRVSSDAGESAMVDAHGPEDGRRRCHRRTEGVQWI